MRSFSSFAAVAVLASALVLPICGCNKDLLKEDPSGMTVEERAKYITKLWRQCDKGIAKATAVPEDDIERRIKILEEEALPYGKRGFEVAGDMAHQPLRGFAQAAALLGGEYALLAKKLQAQSSDPAAQARAAEYRKTARKYMELAARLLLRYERVWQDRRPWPQLYSLMVFNYSNMEDYRSAYLVALKGLYRLKNYAKRRPGDPELDKSIRLWENLARALRKRLIDRLEPVPEDPYGVLP